jgi:uncharacterized protein YndB with AHSA1/START domain
MTILKQTEITKDEANKKLFVVRDFEAPIDLVWKAWTDSKILDKWWAPKPWQARTQSMDFREGGSWLYSMVGPEGEQSFCRCDYFTIIPEQQFSGDDMFCDEKGNKNTEFPIMHWKVEFFEAEGGTRVQVEITFDSIEDLEKIVEMGFKEGFTAAHGNLDELLAGQTV